MGNAKPWQIILIVVGLLTAGISVWWFGLRSNSDIDLLANSIVMVDAETGQLYQFSLKGNRGVMVPERNPDTQKIALIPVDPGESGQWSVTERNRTTLQFLEVPNNVIDRRSGAVNASEAAIIRVNN
jgi:hypothetical protein